MTIEAVLFDMDGVIIDTEQSVIDFWERLAVRHGVMLTEADYRRDVFGCPGEHTLSVFFPMLDADARQSVMLEMADYEQSDVTYIAVTGVIPFLHRLHAHDIPTALITSGARWKVQAVEAQLPLAGLFTWKVTVEDIQHGKPHLQGYLLAAERLSVAPENCVVFEDSLSGVQAAVAAGATCIGIQRASGEAELLKAGACCVIPNFDVVTIQDGTPGNPAMLCVKHDIQLSLAR